MNELEQKVYKIGKYTLNTEMLMAWTVMCYVVLFFLLSVVKFYFFPVKYTAVDLDANFSYKYSFDTDKESTYIFTLSGLKVKGEDKAYVPRLYYSGKASMITTGVVEGRKSVIIPSRLKNESLYGLSRDIRNELENITPIATKSVSIKDIRENYQKIDIDKIILYSDSGIKRLIYNNLDSFKIIFYEYCKEVGETEVYWNKSDSYYYILTPGATNELFSDEMWAKYLEYMTEQEIEAAARETN